MCKRGQATTMQWTFCCAGLGERRADAMRGKVQLEERHSGSCMLEHVHSQRYLEALSLVLEDVKLKTAVCLTRHLEGNTSHH